MLRGCDVRGDGMDTAVALLRDAQASRAAVDLPTEVGVALQQRIGSGVQIITARASDVDDAPWRDLRARTSAGWQQEALARACVNVALDRASAHVCDLASRRY